MGGHSGHEVGPLNLGDHKLIDFEALRRVLEIKMYKETGEMTFLDQKRIDASKCFGNFLCCKELIRQF